MRVRATNDAGSDEALSWHSYVARGAPRFIERVAVGGEPREGAELHAETDGLRGSQPIALAFTWLRCEAVCSSISGATDATYAASAAAVTAPLVDPFVTFAQLNAWGHPCRGGDCDDVEEPADWQEHHLQVPNHPDYPRKIETWFEWRNEPDYFYDRIANEDRRFAWENNIKLYNGNNFDSPGGFFCLGWDKDDFWVASRDADDKILETNLPADAGLYWDTAASDGCDVKDLTYGIYHPEKLEAGAWYYVDIHLNSAGDEDSSTLSWQPQLQERRPPLYSIPVTGQEVECDFNPWCVNVRPFARIGEGTTFVHRDWDYRLPNCWEYDETSDKERAQLCPVPG